MPNEINILHLSDLHYSSRLNAYSRRHVIKAFLDDVKNYCTNYLTIDLIIVSGDLAYAADEEDVYFDLYDNFISPLSKISRCDEDRIFLCPGNHDVQRQVVRKHHASQAAFLKTLQDRDALNSAYESEELFEFTSLRFQHFFDLSQYCGHSSPKYMDQIISVQSDENLCIDVICFNTAWSSFAGLETYGTDLRKLLFPEQAIKRAIEHTTPSHLKVFVTHHPFSWLTESCESDALATLRSLQGQVFFHLYGHMHEVRPQHLSSLEGNWLSAQSGALYTERSRYNGYSVISTTLPNPTPVVSFRSYFDSSRAFAAALDLAPQTDGRFFSSAQAKAFWHELTHRLDHTKVESWVSTELAEKAKSDFDEGFVDRPIGELFVPPPLYVSYEIDEGTDEDVPERQEEPISVLQVVESSSNYIMYGGQEYGKTTLLQQVALGLMQRKEASSIKVTIPALINFIDIKPGQDRIVRLLRSSLQCDLPLGIGLGACLEEGIVTVLVDDVDISDATRMEILRAFISKYRKNRFIFAVATETRHSFSTPFHDELVPDAAAGVSFEHVFIKAFTRHKMRSLVQKWNHRAQVDEETLLNRVVRELAGMQIPSTAVNGTILLMIYEGEPDYSAINRASLIDRFVEQLLQKRSYQEARRGTFDFTNKIHVLADLAGYMAEKDQYVMSESEVLHVFQKYLDSKGLAQSHTGILEHFVEARILAVRIDNTYSFRYRAFLEYFIASQMRISSEFRKWVLEEDNYLRFINEVEYYAGLERDKTGTLALVGERFAMLDSQLSKELDWEPELELVGKFEPASEKEDLFEDIEEQLSSPVLDEEERDEILDWESPRNEGDRQEVYRPVLETLGHEWTACLLLYSGMVKNMDLVSDGEKRKHLQSVLFGWSRFTAHSLMFVPHLAKHRKFTINGVLYEVIAPRHYSEGEVAHWLYLELPMTLTRLVMTHVGSEKLERQLLERDAISEGEPTIVKFFRYTLVADLRLRKWSHYLPTFVSSLEGSRYLTRSYLRKMSDIYLLGGLKKEVARRLQGEIGNVVSRLKGGSAEERRKIKSSAIQRIDRRARVRKLGIDTKARHDSR